MNTACRISVPIFLSPQSDQQIYMFAMAYRLKSGRTVGSKILYIAVTLMLIAMGCATDGQKISEEMTRTFESYQVLPGHRYYQIGWNTRIHAIVALKMPYHMTSELWLKFDANPETLKKRVDALEFWYERGYDRVFGYYIFDEHGNRIGAWYSSIYIFTATVNSDNDTVVISMDKPWATP